MNEKRSEWSKLTRAAFDKAAPKYHEMWANMESWQLEERKYFASLVIDSNPNTLVPVILDAGCGPGRDLKLFESFGLKAIGIDVSDNMLSLARE